jgi:hypothetical protein
VAAAVAERKRKSVKPQADETVTLSHMAAVLENIEQQNRATIEAVFAMERRLTDRFEQRFGAIELRLTALEIAVRKNSEDIRKNSEDIRKNSEDIAKLQLEVQRLAKILGADRDENAIQSLERRVSALEARLGT